jgi:release factor glutamine methyltransferase
VATVASCIAEANERLSMGPHSDRARMDSELLLMHVLERNTAWLRAHGEDDVPQEASARFVELIERRYRGEPIQHIIGECEFYGLPFKVTHDVLVPRPDTEHVVEKVIELAQCFEAPRIADIGTGSGAIAVALAHRLAAAAITATDLSESALAVARENAARNGVSERIRFLPGDLLAPLAGEQFEIVASNPPYVPNTDRALISVEVREYEPALALFGGQDGLDIYRRLIPAAHSALVPGGFIALEIGFTQAEAIERLLAAHGFCGIEFTPDLQGIPRVASAQRAIHA